MESKEKIKNLKYKLLNATGKYSDYRRYWGTLVDVEEEYDETFEIYNQESWMGNTGGTIRDKAAHMLRITGQLFYDMMENAEMELMSVVKEIMNCNVEEQKQIWGKDIFLDKEKIKLENIKESLLEWEEYSYVQDEALENFVKIVEWTINALK